MEYMITGFVKIICHILPHAKCITCCITSSPYFINTARTYNLFLIIDKKFEELESQQPTVPLSSAVCLHLRIGRDEC